MFKKLAISMLTAATAIVVPAVQAADSSMLTSWYGSYFHGRLTANGEIYNMYDFTAAHKTLPFGTVLQVCYTKCVNVRINDRGPYIGSRELDLSYAAAAKIGLLNPGVATTSVTFM